MVACEKSLGCIWPFGEPGLFPSVHALWSCCCCVWGGIASSVRGDVKPEIPLAPRGGRLPRGGGVGTDQLWAWQQGGCQCRAATTCCQVLKCLLKTLVERGAWPPPAWHQPSWERVSPSLGRCRGLRDGDGGGHLWPFSLRAPISTLRWREGNA